MHYATIKDHDNAQGGVPVDKRFYTCCFTGHREAKLPWQADETDPRCLELKANLAKAVCNAYEEGLRHFICGMANGCDLYFAEAVLHLRELHPDLTLEAAVPCPTQADGWRRDVQARYHELLMHCDTRTLISETYERGCMMKRNRYMVDHSRRLIAASNGQRGGAENTIRYAKSKGLEIIRIPLY